MYNKVTCVIWEFKHTLIEYDNILYTEKSTDILLPFIVC